jgi:outer membrane beta-barrel protein
MKILFPAHLAICLGAFAANAAAEEAKHLAPQAQPQLVEGAPLGNENVHVHIVENKPYTNAGHHEVVLYPVLAPLNGKFTTHVGAAAMYSYHLLENLALQVTPFFNYYNRGSGFNQELIDKGRQQALPATALLLRLGVVGGVEVTPIYGKFAFYEGTLGHFSLVLNAGVGYGSTRIQLSPDQEFNCGADSGADCRSASFGDTGGKFLGAVGAGFRVYLGDRLTVRLEVRDLVYTARVDRINGCNYQDLERLTNELPVGAGCRVKDFTYKDTDPGMAKTLLDQTTSDVLNNLSLYTGISLLF